MRRGMILGNYGLSEEVSRYAERMGLRRAYGSHVDDWQRRRTRELEEYVGWLQTLFARDEEMPKKTPSGRKSAVGDVEGKLRKEYGSNEGAVYGTLNKIGLMKGSKTTAKGRRAARGK